MSLEDIEESRVRDAIESFLMRNENLFFVQVGGFDGVSFDPLRAKIVEGRMHGLIIEPLPDNFAKLQTLYQGSERVRPVCCAIDETDGERLLYRFSQRAFEEWHLPPMFAGISSFIMEELLADTGTLGHLFPQNVRNFLTSMVEGVPVPCRRFDSLFAEQGVEKVDLLQIDTEGYDYQLLKSFDFSRFRPAIVNYETQHLSADDKAAAEAMLAANGYVIHPAQYDTLAVQPDQVTL